MSGSTSQLRFLVMSVGLALSLGAVSHQPRRAAPPSTLGAYQIEFRGGISGKGNAVVTPLQVNVQALVRDSAGNTANLVAPGLPLTNGRFDGNGAMAGQQVRVSGRVDPPSDVVPVARLSCVIVIANGERGRAIGAKR
jgi:hypothetical protein